jgi:hypothetical protein
MEVEVRTNIPSADHGFVETVSGVLWKHDPSLEGEAVNEGFAQSVSIIASRKFDSTSSREKQGLISFSSADTCGSIIVLLGNENFKEKGEEKAKNYSTK